MEFNKYIEKGAYHWAMYENNYKYKAHVDYVLNWVQPGSILDIGAGDGLITSKLGAEGIDNNKTAIKLAKEKGANVRFGSAYDLSKEKSYDSVCLLDVIEHLQDYKKALEQVKNILDEALYISTPMFTGKGKFNGLHCKYHYFEWTPKQFKTEIEGCGFKTVRIVGPFNGERMYGKFTL